MHCYDKHVARFNFRRADVVPELIDQFVIAEEDDAATTSAALCISERNYELKGEVLSNIAAGRKKSSET